MTKGYSDPRGGGRGTQAPIEPPQSKLAVSLYLRVSTTQQTEGESLEEQETELRKYCDYR